jgi:hypothetical protein
MQEHAVPRALDRLYLACVWSAGISIAPKPST